MLAGSKRPVSSSFFFLLLRLCFLLLCCLCFLLGFSLFILRRRLLLLTFFRHVLQSLYPSLLQRMKWPQARLAISGRRFRKRAEYCFESTVSEKRTH